jgi:hypothetical protein
MIKDFLTLAFIVLLFVVLTPGLYVTYPSNGSKFVVALSHAIAFALILYFTHTIVRNLLNRTTEGFKSKGGSVAQITKQLERAKQNVERLTESLSAAETKEAEEKAAAAAAAAEAPAAEAPAAEAPAAEAPAAEAPAAAAEAPAATAEAPASE